MANNYVGSSVLYPVAKDLGALATLVAASTGATTAVYQAGGATGIQVRVNITAITGTSPTLTVTIQGYDPTANVAYTILASAALTATGFTTLTFYPGLTAAANSVANAALPALWQVNYAIGGTTPAVTGTITASTLV